jgi:predicted transposase YbfD/YdcC
LIQVKRNQPSLFAEMSELLLDKPMDTFEESEKNHGRHSVWTVSVYDASESPKAAEWPGLSRLIHVHKQKLDTATGQLTHSDRLYICDLNSADASYYAKASRGHWSIENRLHWVKDVRHGEDKNGIPAGNAAMNISTTSSIGLNLHRINGRDKIKKAQMKTAANIKEIICEFRT